MSVCVSEGERVGEKVRGQESWKDQGREGEKNWGGGGINRL